eukprot:178742-Hanusia_phi.AAC.1
MQVSLETDQKLPLKDAGSFQEYFENRAQGQAITVALGSRNFDKDSPFGQPGSMISQEALLHNCPRNFPSDVPNLFWAIAEAGLECIL